MNEQPTLAELRALAAIARHRSFRKAADELNVAPSTLSHTLSALESRMGAKLLNRTTRSVSLTQLGDRLVTRLRPILQDLDAAFLEISRDRDQPRGNLRLSASETVAMLLLQALIPAYLQRFPEMTVDLVAQPALIDIVAEGYDAGIRLAEAVPRDMVTVRMGGPSRMLAVAAPCYLENRKRPLEPQDLHQHVCIRSRTPNGRVYKWEFEQRGRAISLDVNGPLMLNRTELMVEAALRGLGIAFVPQRVAAAHIESGELCALLEDWCPPYPGVFLYYPRHRQLPAGLRAFIQVIKSAPQGGWGI